MRHLIIIDPIERLNLELDSSLKLAKAFVDRGDEVRFAAAETLHARSGAGLRSQPGALTFSLDLDNLSLASQAEDPKYEDLATFSTIHMRKEPPFDLDYITACWILNMVENADRRIFNSPQALLQINEKLSIFAFPEFADHALICQDVASAQKFLEQHGDVIVKPLDLYGGRGISRLTSAELNAAALHKRLTDAFETGPKLIQPFNEAIFAGEVRAFGFGDEVLSWCLKKPKGGSFFANTREGATLHTVRPTPELLQKVVNMGRKLKTMGVLIWGVDIIGDKLSEINVTSPRLLTVDGNEQPTYRHLAELVCKQVAS